MDFMGIGPLELLVILLIGFLLFGPEKLPEMAAKAGKLFRNLKKVTSNLTKTFTEELSTEGKTKEGSETTSVPESDGKVNVENTQKTTPGADEELNE